MPLHPLTNLPKINYGAYAINTEEYKSIGTRWIALHMNSNNVTYFDSFAVGQFGQMVECSFTN